MTAPAFRLGLTGGIGSGKSTVAAMLAELGAVVVDADAISRATTAAGGSAMALIAQHFGASFVTADGALNRDAMRELVFADGSARQRLEAIIHPMVREETERQARAGEQAGTPCLVFDVPLLVESPRWRQQVQAILVVDCTPATQIRRVMTRNAWPREAVEKVVASQASRRLRLAAADVCLYNESASLDELAALVRQAAHRFGL